MREIPDILTIKNCFPEIAHAYAGNTQQEKYCSASFQLLLFLPDILTLEEQFYIAVCLIP